MRTLFTETYHTSVFVVKPFLMVIFTVVVQRSRKFFGRKVENLTGAIEEIKQTIAQSELKCLLIDEIGKMELFAPRFQETVLSALNSPLPVVATILANNTHPFCDALKRRTDVEVIEVNQKNREKLPEELYNSLIPYFNTS